LYVVAGDDFPIFIYHSLNYRYPRFVDALGELDDCLTMVHLFATVPAIADKKIDVDLSHNCRKYVLWGNIIILILTYHLFMHFHASFFFFKVQRFAL
jgi:hypothetical protein